MANQTSNSKAAGSTIAIILVVVAVIAGAVYFLGTGKVDVADSGQDTKIERASDELVDGVENASEATQDRSTGERVGDAIEDTGDAIQDAAE